MLLEFGLPRGLHDPCRPDARWWQDLFPTIMTSHLSAWVKTAKQTTDGHLAQLAKAKGAILAALDNRIPRAFQIPPAK
jgi:hypothetical protein